ncbi:E3 ubiquitin-protein ligase HERC2-like, partial [Clytia hemisphaerica]
MTSSLGIAPLLKPVEKLNKKWLDRDPKDVLNKDVLFKWYNELLSEKEIYIRPDSFLNRDGFASHKSSNGHYYCGQSTLNCSCCNTICGPSHGCNCKSCQEIEETLKENKDLHTSEVFLLKEYVEAWAWGKLPTQKELKNFTKLVAQQQLLLFKKSTESIKFMQNLKPKMFVYARFLSVYSRTCFLPSTMKDAKKAPTEEKSQNKPLIVTNLPKEINTEEEFAHSSLILVFKTAFKYIDSKCGIFEEDIFCTEILNETLNMLQSIAKPLIYDGDEKKSSKLLLGFLKHSADYLYNIISRPIYSLNLSLRYNQTFIELLLEIAFQTTSLTSLLKVANLYMFRKEEGCLLYSYQLEKFLKKLVEQSFQMQFEYAIVSKYFSNCPISGILSDTLSLYESLDKEEDPDQPDKDESPDQPDKDKMSPDELKSYVRIQSMLETLSKNLPDEDESPDEDKSPDEPDKDEENEGKDMYKFVQKLLKALTLTARPLEEYKTEEEKKVATTKQGDELVWGNLKLLSSLKEEKPNVKIANICCTDTLVFILSLNGTVYCCEHDKDKLELKVYPQLKGLKIMQLTCSFDGHFIALTNTGHIITWKDVNSVFEHMTSVPLQIKGKVITVAAGFGFYSITTDQNEVCIWGNTFSGSANYEQHKDGFTPRQFCEFENTKIIDLAFSQYQQEVIFVTEEGKIWSWKNGTTMSLISANYPNVVNVYVAKYFYVALASNGQVYRWGRDRFSKTPHDSEVQLQPVVKLNKESIASISVGAYHCIAITNTSNVYCWGGLGGKEEEEMIIREPVLLKAVSELGVSRIVAGPHQIFCWRVSFINPLKEHVPFAIEINRETFENLEQLLSYSQKVEDPEVKDDLISSCLYLLKMQFHGARAHDVCTCFLGFDGKSEFSQKLKSLVINLISTLPYHSKIHKLAEEVLSVGWLYLLPSAIERATTFSTLLKIKTETNSENHSFLLQLLMKCFLEKNGLEEMLEDTLDLLIANSNNDDFDPTNSTLFILLKELFYVTTSCILVSVKEEDPRLIEQESLNVLLKFQRLMFARVFIVTEKDICWPARCYVYEPTPMVKSLTAVISTFINLLQTSCKQLLVYHSMVRKCSHKRLQESPIGIIFQEFSIYLILLQNYAPIITSNCETFAQFAEILDWFDKLNRSFSENDPEKEKLAEEAELSWPVSTASSVSNVQYDTKKKVENSKDKNEEKDDGAEIECSEKAQEDSLSSFVDKEVSTAIADVLNFTNIKILNKDKTATQPKMMLMSANTKEEGLGQHFVEAEQSIAFVLGLHCCYLAHGTYASHDETENKRFLHSTLFSSGINRDAVLKEKKEKNEEDASSDSDVLSLLSEESCASTGVVMKNVFQMATDEGLLIIPPRGDPTSVIEQTTRCIFACLLWHCGLGTNLKGLQDGSDEKCLLKYKTKDLMLIITRLVAMRSKVFQLHQEEEKPLKEICQPIIKKCQFLCKCVNASQPSSKSHVKRRWIETCERLQKTQDPPYKWRVFLWKGLKNLQQAEQKRTSALNVLIDELKDFLFDKKVNTDILRKCFLMQIKRAKQRLIAGYLMQSLCLRQQIFSHVRYSLLCGWLGLLVPGGSVSHAKPGILFNVELVPKDDVDKLRSVFHGFENFALKALIDEIEKLSDFQTEDEINGHVREMLLSLTLLCSSLMSDDVNFMVLCGVLDKIQKLLKKIMKLTLNNDEKSDIPFIDERKHRQVHLQELDGEEMRKLLKIGSRVVRGPDWKWDDQDGPAPSQGRVVSDIGDDGWVRVEWDTGSRNSYRMGKNGKYDLKLADNIQFFDEDDKDDHVHEKDIKKDNQNEDNQLKSPLSFLLKSMTSYIVNTLSLCACNGEKTSSNALNTVASFFIDSLRSIIDTSVSSWGADISVSAYFGFCRALSCSQQIEKIIGVRDWVTLLVNMFDLSFLMHDPSNGGNSFLVKIQLLKHIKFLLKLQSNNSPFPSKWKRQIVGSMMKALHRMLKQDAIFMTESYDLHAAKSSMAASALTTIAEEIFSLLRYLHEWQEWKEMINFQIWRYLKSLDESTFSVELQTRVFTSLCIIGGIDPRIRVGGLVHHEKHGDGTCVDILPNGKILLYFGNSIKPKTCHLSKLDVKAQSSLNLLTLADYQKHQNLFSCLLSIALKGVTIDWDKQPGGSMIVSKTRLYMSVLACLRILFKEPDLFIKTISREPANRLMLKELVEKALVSSPIQTTYEELELEISGLALSEKMLLDSSSNENNIFAKHDTKTTFSQKTTTKSSKKLSSEMIASMPSLSHVLEMGFTVESVEHALNELGEDTRAERLVSWLLQHPEVQKKGAVASEGSAESEQPRDVSLFHPHEAGLSKFPIGCLVKTILKAGDVDEYGLGTVVKVIGADENILVYWETQNKALWTTADKIQIVDDFMKPKTLDVIKEGSYVRIKQIGTSHKLNMTPLLLNRVGTVTYLHHNGLDCSVTFEEMPLWHGTIRDLELVGPVHSRVTCDGCERKPVVGVRYKCKTCDDFDFCEHCFANKTDHDHNFVAYHRSKKGQHPIEAGKPGRARTEWCHSSSEKHLCIKEMTVSSNEHMAAKMINKEIDMPWISEKAFGAHKIDLTINPHVLITNMSVVLDVDQNETYPSRFTIFAGASKNQTKLIKDVYVKGNQSTVQLLHCQEELYSFVEIQIFVGDGSTESSCKICHLSLTGQRRRKDYDQLIMKMICSVQKKSEIKDHFLQIKQQYDGFTKQKNANKQIKIFGWGLNDKDQLGGLKGSKIKSPVLCSKMSSLHCKEVVGGSKTMFCISNKGHVYACGHSAGGRLGLGPTSDNVASPQLIEALKGHVIKKIAVHARGVHCLALTDQGEVFSWGDNEFGKLGHGDTTSLDTPKLVEALRGLNVTHLACGSNHSAVIVDHKELYTWGSGEFGRLGHGDEETHFLPKLIKSLLPYNIIDVSCGSTDAQTLALSSDGNIWSWGDGDFGKLGRGGSEGCLSPTLITKLSNQNVCKVLCGAQFSLALTKNGEVWTWGKGDFYRLGHGCDQHYREPKLVEGLIGKKIVDIAVGVLHCLAVSENGEVYAWGDNDHGQQGVGTTMVCKTPTRLLATDGYRIQRVACGSSHSFAWCETNNACDILDDFHIFSPALDPLGTSVVLQKHPFRSPSLQNIAKMMKDQRPSLVRTVLQLHSKDLQKEALNKILQAAEILFCRQTLTQFLKNIKQIPEATSRSLLNEVFGVECLVNLLKLAINGHSSSDTDTFIEDYLKEMCYKNIK